MTTLTLSPAGAVTGSPVDRDRDFLHRLIGASIRQTTQK